MIQREPHEIAIRNFLQMVANSWKSEQSYTDPVPVYHWPTYDPNTGKITPEPKYLTRARLEPIGETLRTTVPERVTTDSPEPGQPDDGFSRYETRTVFHYRGEMEIHVYGPNQRSLARHFVESLDVFNSYEALDNAGVVVIRIDSQSDNPIGGFDSFESRSLVTLSYRRVRTRITYNEVVREVTGSIDLGEFSVELGPVTEE